MLMRMITIVILSKDNSTMRKQNHRNERGCVFLSDKFD